jgi:nitric oxide reductase NorD protein
LAEGVTACGDDLAIHGFSSLRRDRVFVRTVKEWGEPLGPSVRARIAGLKPGLYTRMGAAIRFVSDGLSARPNRKKLLLVVTDGKPNDLDHYEGRYGIEDTRRAVMEARRRQIAVFGVTVDKRAQHYFPFMFGANGFAIVPKPERLGEALALVWQHLVD